MRFVAPPDEGFWRIGRAPDPLDVGPPLEQAELDDRTVGNRFDSPTGSYRVRYFGSSLEVCYGETLARFRPDPVVVDEVEDEDGEYMAPGCVPADWRLRRLAVRARIDGAASPPETRFLDVEALETREQLRVDLGAILAFYGYSDLDVAVVRGSDRRVTRFISQYAFSLLNVAGIRYLSRLNSRWECWAVFDGVPLVQLEVRGLTPTDDAVEAIERAYKIKVF